MDGISIKEIIIRKFNKTGGTGIIPLMKSNRTFTATYNKEGVKVSNLGSQGLLSWEVFYETIEILNKNGGKASKGDAMKGKLGDIKLPLDSVEGYIAYKVYGKALGKTVFRRISPISGILKWAEICLNERGILRLKNVPSESDKYRH